MSLRGMEAVMTVESATDCEVFLTYLEQVLCPKLACGAVVIMDNLSVQKEAGIRELIEGHGARLLYLPPLFTDLNPIEKAWFKFKQFLRSAKARTQQALDLAITEAFKTISTRTLSPGSGTAATGYSNRSSALNGRWKCRR